MKKIKSIIITSLVLGSALFFSTNVSAADYYAEYWNVGIGEKPAMPTSDPIATTTVSAIDFFWGDGSPAGVNSDGFVARYTKTVGSGFYDMTLTSDDGSRVYFDGVKVMDMWQDQGSLTMYDTHTVASSGPHTLIVEFYENAGGAELRFSYDLTVTAEYLAGPNGSISGTSTQYLVNGASSTAVTAVPNNGYRFVNWSDGSTMNPRIDSSLEENISVTANFVASPFTVVYLAGNGGSITGSTTQQILIGSSTSVVEAVPDTGYSFIRWNDGVTTTSRFEGNVSASATHTAEFLLNTFTVAYLAGTGGNIIGSSTQIIGYGLGGSEVSARASSGYHFTGWSDGLSSLSRQENNVITNKSLSANFERDISSTPVILPGAVGTGRSDVEISMNESQNIKLVTPSGTNVLAYINSRADFQAPESSKGWIPANHSFTVTNLDLASNILTLTISSNPQKISLRIGESRDIDLDSDTKEDVQIIFAGVYVNRAEITIKSLSSAHSGVKMPASSELSVTENLKKPTDFSKKAAIKEDGLVVGYLFKRDLKLGLRGSDVKELQKYLNQHGFLVAISGHGSVGLETDYFGMATKSALINFQKAKGISPALGYFGPITREVFNKIK